MHNATTRKEGKGRRPLLANEDVKSYLRTRSYPGEKEALGAEFQVVESIHHISLEREEC